MKNKNKKYTRIFWMANQLWDTTEPIDKNTYKNDDYPTVARLEEAAILYHLAKDELHMSNCERAGYKDAMEIKRLLRKGVTF